MLRSVAFNQQCFNVACYAMHYACNFMFVERLLVSPLAVFRGRPLRPPIPQWLLRQLPAPCLH
jgi:hypothetical protein